MVSTVLGKEMCTEVDFTVRWNWAVCAISGVANGSETWNLDAIRHRWSPIGCQCNWA